MKKFISIILALAMIFTVALTPALASAQEEEITEYPVIMVAGYSSSTLVLKNEDGTDTQVWHLQGSDVLGTVFGYVGRIIAGLGLAALYRPKYLAGIIGNGAKDLVGVLACNDDGSSKYPVEPFLANSAEECNCQNMLDRFGDESYQHETDIMGMVSSYVGKENTYNFNCDFRMGAVECAERLDEFIQSVKEYTGKDKVNILAVSHGGQVTGTYLSLFGYKRDVNNCVMTVPALGGAGLLYDLLGEETQFDELNLMYFIEHGCQFETDYHWLVEAEELGFLDPLITELIPYFMEYVIGNWGSIWDFVPTDRYEELKAKWLDPVDNAELIRKSDYMHYEIMPTFYTAFQKCNELYGMRVSIIAGTDNGITTGAKVNSDGIIPTAASTGAYCAPFGERFADGYTQKNECGGSYKVSPAMTVDASCAYLPDTTWFVSGLFHGMTFWDYFTRELMMELLLKNNIENVYSSEEYPQFHLSTNPSYAVSAWFDSSEEGFVSSLDSALTLKNLSITDKPLKILAITCDGADLSFKLPLVPVIKAGEEISIPFKGDIPAVSKQKISITVSYKVYGTVTPIGERHMSFTIMDGESASYSDENVSALPVTPLDRALPGSVTAFLKNAGIYNLVSMFYTIFYAAINAAVDLVR